MTTVYTISGLKHRYTSQQQKASFLFDIRISFIRSFEETDAGRKQSKEVSDIQIGGAVFEPIPAGDIPLESKRGIFITPNDNDQKFMTICNQFGMNMKATMVWKQQKH